MTTRSLADRVRRHDPAALAAFLEERRPALLAFIERRLGLGPARQAGAAGRAPGAGRQGAARAAATPTSSTRDPFGWLCHLAEQCIVDGHRHFAAGKRAAGREVPGNVRIGDGSQDLVALLAASLTSPSMAAVRDERQQRLMDVIADFPDEHREALRLRYGEGLPTKEVAAKLGKSDVATRVLVVAAGAAVTGAAGGVAVPRPLPDVQVTGEVPRLAGDLQAAGILHEEVQAQDDEPVAVERDRTARRNLPTSGRAAVTTRRCRSTSRMSVSPKSQARPFQTVSSALVAEIVRAGKIDRSCPLMMDTAAPVSMKQSAHRIGPVGA